MFVTTLWAGQDLYTWYVRIFGGPTRLLIRPPRTGIPLSLCFHFLFRHCFVVVVVHCFVSSCVLHSQRSFTVSSVVPSNKLEFGLGHGILSWTSFRYRITACSQAYVFGGSGPSGCDKNTVERSGERAEMAAQNLLKGLN